jgi:uncharacterized protein YcbX
VVQVSALNRYPIKSCRGVPLESASVRPWGLAGDRRWMLVDDRGDCVTAREQPRLVLVRVDLIRPGRHFLRVSAPGRPELEIAEPDAAAPQSSFGIFRQPVVATPAAPAAHRWFSEFLGISVRLVFLDDPTSRKVDPDFGDGTDVVSFADGYPLLLTTVESLAALNELISAGRWAGEGPLPMSRFRPSVVVDGAPAWAEDQWRRIRIGDVGFRVVKGCARCVLTTVDPETGTKGREPLVTLGRHRNWDGKIWFGMNVIPDVGNGPLDQAPVVRVGDTVELVA